VRALKLAPMAMLLGMFAPSAWAQAACPAAAVWQQASLERLSQWAEACDENAFFHAHWGAVLLAQGQTEAAAVALEKALLLNPDLPGAQLDYAQALAQIGLKGSARAMLKEVLQRPDIQPTLKAQLLPAQTASAGASALDWQWSSLLQSSYGHESNLNSATYTDTLTLYLSNGPVTLGLSDNVKPMPGNALKSSAALQGSLKGLGSHELSLNVVFANKAWAASEGGNNQTAEGAIRVSLPLAAGRASGTWQVALGHAVLAGQSNSLRRQRPATQICLGLIGSFLQVGACHRAHRPRISAGKQLEWCVYLWPARLGLQQEPKPRNTRGFWGWARQGADR